MSKNNPTDPRIEERIKYRHKRECEVVTGIECVDCHANLQQELTACADAARKEAVEKIENLIKANREELVSSGSTHLGDVIPLEKVLKIVELAKPKGENES